MKLFPDRLRDHEHLHARSTESQTLDALLRIEELLTKLVDANEPKALTVAVPADAVIDKKPGGVIKTTKKTSRFL